MWAPVLEDMRGAKNQDVDLKECAIYWGRQSYHTSDNKLNHVAKYSLGIQGSSWMNRKGMGLEPGNG